MEITGDSERLAQVVTNLLVNAVQYNRPEGEVRVKLENQAGLAVLAVSDTGPGISGEDLPHVFERFYRGDKSRTTSNGNAGLGLAISKAIVEAHGGTIEVASQEQVGTTFTVRLPARFRAGRVAVSAIRKIRARRQAIPSRIHRRNISAAASAKRSPWRVR